MASRLDLLREFYGGLAPNTAKIETTQCGLDFLPRLLSGGVRLAYGELTPLRLVHRYKLVEISESRMTELLQAHLDGEWNVCRYFMPHSNNLFCFNLDNNHRVQNAAVIPEMDVAVRALREHLSAAGCYPFIVASGRGYHAWCRLSDVVENERIFQFMLRTGALALGAVRDAGYDHESVKLNLYPYRELQGMVSLRLFGSHHVKTGRFSQVWTVDGLLDEGASWECFEQFVRHRQVSRADFDAACSSSNASIPA